MSVQILQQRYQKLNTNNELFCTKKTWGAGRKHESEYIYPMIHVLALVHRRDFQIVWSYAAPVIYVRK